MSLVPLTPNQREIFDATVQFARSLDHDVSEADREGTFPRESWKRCAEHGLLGFLMPEEYGGMGGGAVDMVVAYHALGYGCRDNGLCFALASQLLSCQVPLLHAKNDVLRDEWLPALISGEKIAAHAASEPDAGSDINRVRTVARAVEGGFRITGSKTFTSLGPESDCAIVLARMDGEDGLLTEFLVSREAYDATRPIEKIGIRSAPMSEVVFEDAFVPEGAVLGSRGSGFMAFMTTMEWERLLIMAPAIGAMERQLEECVRYARQRKQFGRAIGDFQAVAHRIARMKLRLETSRMMLYQAARQKDEDKRTMLEACMVKLHLSESFHDNALDAVRVYGGYGVTAEGGVERQLRDSITSLVYSGTSDIQLNTIARLMGMRSGG